MALMPATVVADPEPRGLRYGLFTAASGPLSLSGVRGGLGAGVRYSPVSCGRAHRYPIECDDTPPSKTFDEGADTIHAAPFLVYASETCGSVGTTAADMVEAVRRKMANGEQAEAERELADLLAADSQPVVSSDPGDLTYVVAELEEYLYNTASYGNVGVLHAPILAAAQAMSAGLIVESRAVPGLLTTRMGTAWSFGAYPDAGVMYITGNVTVWRADDIAFPPNEQTFDRSANQWYALAEREYAVAWDCVAAQAPFTPDSLS